MSKHPDIINEDSIHIGSVFMGHQSLGRVIVVYVDDFDVTLQYIGKDRKTIGQTYTYTLREFVRMYRNLRDGE